jgi:hypothetical protein
MCCLIFLDFNHYSSWKIEVHSFLTQLIFQPIFLLKTPKENREYLDKLINDLKHPKKP